MLEGLDRAIRPLETLTDDKSPEVYSPKYTVASCLERVMFQMPLGRVRKRSLRPRTQLYYMDFEVDKLTCLEDLA